MTSKQVMLIWAVLTIGGCHMLAPRAEPQARPYERRHVLAVAPLLNESGNSHADGYVLADHLAHQLENVPQVDVLPVNRTIEAMEATGLTRVTSYGDAMRISETLGADGLVVGSIMGYDPYDPPKLALAIELYPNPRSEQPIANLDIRKLRKAPSGRQIGTGEWTPSNPAAPVNIVSHYFDAADPKVSTALRHYAQQRGVDKNDPGWHRHLPWASTSDWSTVHLHRINMDLFSQFVCHQMSWQLMQAEARRRAPRQVAHPDPSS